MPKISKSHLWLAVPVSMFLFTVIMIVSTFMSGKEARIEKAIASSKRIELSLVSGELRGNLEGLKGESILKDKKIKVAKKDDGDEGDEENTAEKDDGGDNKQEENKVEKATTASNATTESEQHASMASKLHLGDKPVIVIILKGLGLSSSNTERALGLPPIITLGFSPYSPTVKKWVKQSIQLGYDVVLNVPMETKDYKVDDPGPYALLTNYSKDDNLTRLNMLLSLVDGYVGIYSEPKEVFTKELSGVKPVLDALKSKRASFIYGGGYGNFSLIQMADNIDYPILVNDVILDEEISVAAIDAKLKELETIAKENGVAIGMAHPYPLTIRMLERWLPDVDDRGLKIVPISSLLKLK